MPKLKKKESSLNYDLGISIPYSRVLELSTCLGNKVLQHYQHNNVVCPSTFKIGVFMTAAVDNIDHNPCSKTAEESFRGTGISLFQHCWIFLHVWWSKETSTYVMMSCARVMSLKSRPYIFAVSSKFWFFKMLQSSWCKKYLFSLKGHIWLIP